MTRISTALALVGDTTINGTSQGEGHTKLDSHANMCVLGKYCYLLSELSTARTVSAGAFAESAGGLEEVPIVDAMLSYDCEQTNQTYLLVPQNVLSLDSMDDSLIPPFFLRETGIIVNKRAKIHCDPDTVTEEDHTIQDLDTGLFITMQLRSIFSYFLMRKPSEDDIEDGGVVIMTPEGVSWDANNQNFTDKKRSMTNKKEELRQPIYKRKEFVEEDGLENINSILVMDDNVNRHNKDAVIAASDAQAVDFLTEKEVDIGYRMSEAAATAVKPFSLVWNPVFESMPVGQDQVSAIISSVSNSLEPQWFYGALETQTAVSKLKMSVGATSIIEPEEEDDLWTNEEPWNVMIDNSSLEKMVEGLDSDIAATATKAKGVTPERLSKIWSINIETAKGTIKLTSQHVKHEGSIHLKQRYATNDRMLRYKQIQTHFCMDIFQVTVKAVSQ